VTVAFVSSSFAGQRDLPARRTHPLDSKPVHGRGGAEQLAKSGARACFYFPGNFNLAVTSDRGLEAVVDLNLCLPLAEWPLSSATCGSGERFPTMQSEQFLQLVFTGCHVFPPCLLLPRASNSGNSVAPALGLRLGPQAQSRRASRLCQVLGSLVELAFGMGQGSAARGLPSTNPSTARQSKYIWHDQGKVTPKSRPQRRMAFAQKGPDRTRLG
jgi:hypothetical protein